MTVQTDNYGIGASGTASQKFTFTAPNNDTFKLGRGVLGAESSFPIVVNADDSISGVFSGVGVGQTLQTVTGSRVLNTNYTNSTGKPITVVVQIAINLANVYAILTVGSEVVPGSATGNVGYSSVVSWVVPNGVTYNAYINSGTPTLQKWMELR